MTQLDGLSRIAAFRVTAALGPVPAAGESEGAPAFATSICYVSRLGDGRPSAVIFINADWELDDMREGYRINGTDFILLAYGAYGDVFASQSSGLVRKVFRREQDEGCARRTCGYELHAHELALADVNASRLVPARFQRVPEVRIMDTSGIDRTDLYYADLVFEMDWIRAYFTKMEDLKAEERAALNPFVSQLHAIGIQYMKDASVAWATAIEPTFIDFATEEFEVVWRG